MSALALLIDALLPNGRRARRRPSLDPLLMAFGLLAGVVTGMVIAQKLMTVDASLINGYVAAPALLTFALGLVLGKRLLDTVTASLTALGTAAAVMAAIFVYQFIDAITFW